MSSTPFFISTPRIESARTFFSADRIGSTGSVRLFVSNPITGSKLDYITVVQSTTASGAGVAQRCWVWLCDASGNNPIIIRELSYNTSAAIPISGPYVIIGETLTFNFINGMYLGTNSSIYVGQYPYTDNRDSLHWIAFGADL